jgi:signal peptidase I
MYAGRPKFGLLWYGIILTATVLFAPLAARSAPVPLNVAILLIPFLCYLFAAVSAVRLAKKVRGTYAPTLWNRWYIYVFMFVAGAIVMSFGSDLAKAFIVTFYKIPAASMMPTLLIGDHILVDRLAYRNGQRPRRGDIIVFKYPEDETKDFIKRVEAISGDIVEIRDKQVILNGVLVGDESHTQRLDPEIIDRSVHPRDNFGPVTIPEDSYFVLGDNRDQSLDSRFWGYVHESKIKGKATVIYWSCGQNLRWDRIGRKVL